MNEDIAEIIIEHFPNASRHVMQEMLEEFTHYIARKTVERAIEELDSVDSHYWNDDDTDVIVDMYVSKYVVERKAELESQLHKLDGEQEKS